jgi:citronellyl-CoA dehydrogenase
LGFYYILNNFDGERLVGALTAVAGAQRMLDQTVEFCMERKAFDRPVIGFQTVRHLLVQLEAELESARQLCYRAVQLLESGENAKREISMAKLIGGELSCRVADRCLQLHGGAGYMAEYPISRAWRDARLITIGGGTSEIMRELLSKLQGFPMSKPSDLEKENKELKKRLAAFEGA